ncbi:hypothetical protein EDD38_2349 [Kitasatospora cineracea]|uniref:Uncharacterized protein n=1 Tax=Kitasatospora cineracea TaxID=88074 RepID=A0A3N4RSG0_9ACTN|nr:hypothetical protein EDD38_2349 [Kitasatospora cineracea]
MTPVISAAVAAPGAVPGTGEVPYELGLPDPRADEVPSALGEFGPVPVVRADPAAALVGAWRAAAGAGSTHHLVVRAGTELAPGFAAELVRAVAGRPRAALVLSAAGGGSRNAGAVRLAALRGCGWAAAVPQDCLSPAAVLLPSGAALAFAGFAAGALAAGAAPGGLLPAFARRHRLDLLLHVGGLAASPAATGAPPRPSAAQCAGAAGRSSGGVSDLVSPLPEVLPRLSGGRALISLWDAGTATWRQASWTRHMARSGRNWPVAAPAAAFVAVTDRPTPSARERVLPLTEVVRYGLALGTVLGRAPVETAAPVLRPCLCAAVLDAAGPVPAPEWPDDWTDELTDVLWRAVGVGARLRSNHGVEHWPAEELRALPADAPPCGGPEPAEPPPPGGARPSPTPRP